MMKIFGWLTGFKMPSVGTWIVIGVVLSVLGSVGYLSYDYAQRGASLRQAQADIRAWENEKKIWIKEQMALMDVRDSLVKKVDLVLDSARTDRENYAEREALMQRTVRDVRKKAADEHAILVVDRDYWKDYSEKLETGEYEVVKGIWPFRGKRLVKKKGVDD